MGKVLPSLLLSLFLFCSLGAPLYADEELPSDLDDLFSAEMPEEEGQEPAGEPEPPKVDVDALAKDNTRISGRVSAGLGMGAGETAGQPCKPGLPGLRRSLGSHHRPCRSGNPERGGLYYSGLGTAK
jgi:hypothetical protein